MDKIKIIKKNDEYSSEYQIGDTFKIEGTWYGGVHIIGKTGAPVSLDKDETKWKEAIAKDGLTWTHVSNLKFWDEPIAKLYSVESIPATFILDENGIIVAKDLRGDALKAKIKELLEVK